MREAVPAGEVFEARGSVHRMPGQGVRLPPRCARFGPRAPVRVEADKDVLPLVETHVEGGTLHVGFKPHTRLFNSGEVTVSAQTPELHAAAASSGAIVKATLTKSDESGLDASSGGEIRVRGIDARKLVAKASGGGVLQAAGRAELVELR